MKEIFAELNKIEALIEAKGWPDYSVDPELCMARYLEFIAARDALMASRGTTWYACQEEMEKTL